MLDARRAGVHELLMRAGSHGDAGTPSFEIDRWIMELLNAINVHRTGAIRQGTL
jgi:hypothetical protein